MKSYKFRAKTHEGHMFKVLIELLQGIISSACFSLTQKGIFLRMFDSQQKILVNLELNADDFSVFELKEDMNLGLNLGHFFKRLRSIKKKDPLLLYVDEEQPDQLQFTISPQDNTRKVHAAIQIKSMQSVTCPLPVGYHRPIKIPSNDFQSSIKDMNGINTTLCVKMRRYRVEVFCGSNNISSSRVEFGDLEEEDPEVIYDEKFDMEIFVRILKIAGMGKILNIQNGGAENPLRLETNVGQLGNISLYIKSNRFNEN